MVQTVIDKANNVKKLTSTETLKVKLADDEVLKFSEDLARSLDEYASLEDELETLKANYKSKMTAVEARVTSLKNLVRDKCDFRKVDVEEVFDNKAGTVVKTRLDTHEIIGSRTMTADERQSKLFDVGADEESDEE